MSGTAAAGLAQVSHSASSVAPQRVAVSAARAKPHALASEAAPRASPSTTAASSATRLARPPRPPHPRGRWSRRSPRQAQIWRAFRPTSRRRPTERRSRRRRRGRRKRRAARNVRRGQRRAYRKSSWRLPRSRPARPRRTRRRRRRWAAARPPCRGGVRGGGRRPSSRTESGRGRSQEGGCGPHERRARVFGDSSGRRAVAPSAVGAGAVGSVGGGRIVSLGAVVPQLPPSLRRRRHWPLPAVVPSASAVRARKGRRRRRWRPTARRARPRRGRRRRRWRASVLPGISLLLPFGAIPPSCSSAPAATAAATASPMTAARRRFRPPSASSSVECGPSWPNGSVQPWHPPRWSIIIPQIVTFSSAASSSSDSSSPSSSGWEPSPFSAVPLAADAVSKALVPVAGSAPRRRAAAAAAAAPPESRKGCAPSATQSASMSS